MAVTPAYVYYGHHKCATMWLNTLCSAVCHRLGLRYGAVYDEDGFDRDLGKPETDDGFDRTSFLRVLEKFFSSRELSTDWETMKDADNELLVNSLSMLLDFAPEDKQALLEAPCLRTRRETLVTLIEFAMRGGSNEEQLQ